MNRSLAFLYGLSALSISGLVTLPVACSSDDSAAPPDQPTGDFDSGLGDDSPDTVEDTGLPSIEDSASTPVCTLNGGNDPVGLCVQKAVLLAEHGQLLPDAGVAAYWSVAQGTTATNDAGGVLHDFHDDVAYGSSLAAYYAASTAYGDQQIQSIVTADLGAVATIVESELATLPAEYDGELYFRLRRFAAGLRLTNYLSDAYAIDLLAEQYGRAIYTNYFHALAAASAPVVDAATTPDDAGGVDAASADAGPSDAGSGDAQAADGGSAPMDGILGVPAGSGSYAYQADQAAAGAYALADMASRALNGTLFPIAVPPDAGDDASTVTLVDAALPPPDTTDALAWSQASLAVFTHLDARARDATSSLYFTSLVTSSDVGHDTVVDTGTLTSDTQGLVALSLLRAQTVASSVPALATFPFVDKAQALLNAAQGMTLSLWDTLDTDITTAACAGEEAGSVCGSGFFASATTQGVLDTRKTIRGNAFLFAAFHRSDLGTHADLLPLRVLFVDTKGAQDGFFTQVSGQSGYLTVVARDFNFVDATDAGADGGPLVPFAEYYSAAANADALEGLSEQWVGIPGAPPFFQ